MTIDMNGQQVRIFWQYDHEENTTTCIMVDADRDRNDNQTLGVASVTRHYKDQWVKALARKFSLLKLADQFFGKNRSDLKKEFLRQAFNSGVHFIPKCERKKKYNINIPQTPEHAF